MANDTDGTSDVYDIDDEQRIKILELLAHDRDHGHTPLGTIEAIMEERDEAWRSCAEAGKDGQRLRFMVLNELVPDGLIGIDKDRYDRACDLAAVRGHAEVTKEDEVDAFAAMIDEMMAKEISERGCLK